MFGLWMKPKYRGCLEGEFFIETKNISKTNEGTVNIWRLC